MARSLRIFGKFMWLGLLSGILAIPLAAEEFTVTVPPDDTPAQSDDPTAHPTDAAPAADAAPTAAPAMPTAEAPAEPAPAAAAEAAPPPPPVKKHKAKAAATAAHAEETPAGDGAAAPAKPAKKKTAKASCLNLAEDACGTNTACIWVAAGTSDAGKETKARCRSLAILKKEEDKARKAAAAKPGEPEVLPWATNATATTPVPTATTTSTAEPAKPVKKTKTATAKKPKPKPAAAPVEEAPGDTSADPSSASGAD